VGIKNVTVNEPYFQGHWPKVPVMPGVLLIEVMAQVSSLVLVESESSLENGGPTQVAFLVGIDRARLHRSVVPGDQIVVEAELVESRDSACKVKALAKIDGVVAAEAEMLFGLMNNPQ
jgi:3-hydroxyacyl-[acyl-carrier-protein] dehydratase